MFCIWTLLHSMSGRDDISPNLGHFCPFLCPISIEMQTAGDLSLSRIAC